MDSLFEKLEAYDGKGVYPFHMPGHKRNPVFRTWKFPFERDITEIDGFDNLHHAEGILKEAQHSLCEVYGALQSFYSVNGSTAAVLAAVSACVPKGGEIIMARNCHKSVYHAVYLRGLVPVYLYPSVLTESELNGGISADQVEEALKSHPGAFAVILTSPTYDGILSDIKRIAAIVHERGKILIVDEAHGAHLHFSSYFPSSAVDCNADLVIHSLHKTLPCMTQTAALHVCTHRPDVEAIQRFLQIYQTSSPSYILMASLDRCVKFLQEESRPAFEQYVTMLDQTRSVLRKGEALSLMEPDNGYAFDPSKILLASLRGEVTGLAISAYLREKYRIEVESAGRSYVLALSSVGDTREGMIRLIEAAGGIDKMLSESREKQTVKEWKPDGFYPKLKQEIILAAAMDLPCKTVPVSESAGMVSVEFAYLYPPGIPLIVPGEIISEDLVDLFMDLYSSGYRLHGTADYTQKTIRVALQEAACP